MVFMRDGIITEARDEQFQKKQSPMVAMDGGRVSGAKQEQSQMK